MYYTGNNHASVTLGNGSMAVHLTAKIKIIILHNSQTSLPTAEP